MNTIDFHAHIVPAHYPLRPDGVAEPAWPSMEQLDDHSSRMLIGGKPYRVFESFYWDVEQRIEQMDRNGVALEVLSPLPELLSYWLEPQAAAVLCEYMNGVIGDMVRRAPTRFAGLGAVALQDIPCAIRQLELLQGEHGLKGVHLGSNINGISLADPAFHPFFEAAEDAGLVLLVHGIKPGGLDRLPGSPLMGPVIGVPHETTSVIASLIMADILGKFPGLKLVFSHAGGGIGAVLGRFDMVWRKFEVMRVNGDVPPREYAQRFWYDTVTFSPEYLSFMVQMLGAERFVAGTDGPTEIGQKDLPGFLRQAGLSADERKMISCDNATELLAL